MAERIASGEIHIDLDDEAAVAGLRKIEADFQRTMSRIDREEATVELKADHQRLKQDLAKATAEVKRYEREVEKAENNIVRANKRRALEKRKSDEDYARTALRNHERLMAAKSEEMRQAARADAQKAAIARREEQRARVAEAQRRRKLADEARELRSQNALAREMARTNRERERAVTSMYREERQIKRLQRQYVEAQDKVERFRKEIESIRTPRPIRQRLELKSGEAIAEMELIRAELAAMGKVPIHQEIELDVDRSGADTLNKWISALTETTVRIGPLTTTIAGLARGLLLLGPILSGLTGQVGAFTAVAGSGLAGAIGITTAAIGAFGVSLGGIGFLLPSLLRDFGNLNTLQNAYHVQVLKTGRNSEKAKTKLEEFEHALGEVAPTTRRAFLSLDKLQERWRNLSREARPTFFNMLGEGIRTLNHHFGWFQKNTLAAFETLNEGWGDWMEGLRSPEATRILQTLGRQGNASLLPLMQALGNIATGIGRVAESFSRHLPGLMRGFRDWTAGFAGATEDADKLNDRTQKMIDSMRAVGRLVMATGRVITAFFSPGVDDGTEMINGWADGLNKLAREMRTTKRAGLNEWFRESINTANKFWGALKPVVQLFFEWTTIMRPFANAALDALRPIASIVQELADLWVVRTGMQVAFGIWATGAIMGRVVKTASAMKDIASAMKGMTAAGAGSKLMHFLSGGLLKSNVRGMTPATPVYVMNVGPGGGPGGGPVGGRGGGGGGLAGRVGGALRVGGGVAAAAGSVVLLTKALDDLHKKKGLEQLDRRLEAAVKRRDLSGLQNLRKQIKDFGGNADDFVPRINKAIDVLNKLDDQDANRLVANLNESWRRIRNDTKVTFERVSNLASMHFRIIEQNVGKRSFAAQQAASKNFWKAQRSIKSAMKAGTIDTDEGLALIERLWVKALSFYGFTPKQAKNIRQGQTPWGGREEGTTGFGKAQGGLIQVGRKGQRGPDSVPFNLGGIPSIVAPGEQIAVFNDYQQKKFAATYPGGLEGFFSGPQPRHGFAAGGIVPVPGFPGESAASSILDEIRMVVRRWPSLILTDAYGQGHSSPGHTIYGTAADFSGPDGAMDSAVRALVRAGYLVGYDGRFGSERWDAHGPSYVTPNFHFHVEFGGKGGRLGPGMEAMKIPRVTMQDGLGMMSAVGQGALDTTRNAANANLQAVADASLAMPVGGGHSAPGAGAASRSQMVNWARIALSRTRNLGHGGPTAANVSKILQLAMKESSWIVRSINNWDTNAAAGNPSGGLMHVTVDKVGGSFARLFNPVENMVASIIYQMGRYRQLITFSPYAQGGIATMGSNEWARGGKIEQPTLMTGEDKGKHPEFVIGTNPMFKHSNLDALHAAAAALGIPQARKSRRPPNQAAGEGSLGHRKPKFLHNRGKEVDKLPPVREYARLQGREEDTNREISIATSRVREPDSFIKQVGTDADGEPLYVVDEGAISGYWSQLNSVKVLYDRLLGPGRLLDQLAAAADRSYKRIAEYITRRQENIQQLDHTIELNRRLARSKDDDTARSAERRLAKAKNMRDGQEQKIRDARGKRGEIRDDQEDAFYRRQEYGVNRDDLIYDMGSIRGRAEQERDSSNPRPPEPETPDTTTPEEPTGPTRLEQVNTLSTARQELYQQFGSNFRPVLAALTNVAAQATSPMPASLRSYYATAASAPSAYTAVASSAAASAMPSSRAAAGTSAAGSLTMGQMGGTTEVNITNNFPTPPADPHTWSRNIAWELRAAL